MEVLEKLWIKNTGLMAKEIDAGGNIKGCGDLIYGSFRKALDKKQA